MPRRKPEPRKPASGGGEAGHEDKYSIEVGWSSSYDYRARNRTRLKRPGLSEKHVRAERRIKLVADREQRFWEGLR